MTRAQLDALTRPVAGGFLRSQPSKPELLPDLDRIRRRQERRPAWMPRAGADGQPIQADERPDSGDEAEARKRPSGAFPELGEITTLLPVSWPDRPELDLMPGGAGDLGSVLAAVLYIGGDGLPSDVVVVDTASNEALVPADVRWWPDNPDDTERPRTAAQDAGVASELLATLPTLAGRAVGEDESDIRAVELAVATAGDWRHSPKWQLRSGSPFTTSRR